MHKKRLEYLRSPNLCLECRSPILPADRQKLAEVTSKKFCDIKCAGVYKSRTYVKQDPKIITCLECGQPFERWKTKLGAVSKSKRCMNCISPKHAIVRFSSATTKGMLFLKRTNYQSARSTIQRLARKTYLLYNSSPACIVCGYDRHVEISHKTAVSNFPEDALISEINHIDNLVPLCPTHHWEFDNGLLSIQ